MATYLFAVFQYHFLEVKLFLKLSLWGKKPTMFETNRIFSLFFYVLKQLFTIQYYLEIADKSYVNIGQKDIVLSKRVFKLGHILNI